MDNSFLFTRGRNSQIQEEKDLTYVKGYLLLAFTLLSLVIGVYIILVSKFMPDTGNNILDFIKHVCKHFKFVLYKRRMIEKIYLKFI